MLFLQSNFRAWAYRWARLLLLALAFGLLAGCIADTAEDSDLPWARNQGWEGMIPLPMNSPSGPAYD